MKIPLILSIPLEFEHVELHISYLLAARMDRVMLLEPQKC